MDLHLKIVNNFMRKKLKTLKIPVLQIEAAIEEVFDLRPAAIIRDLNLLRPIYSATASYGHFGRELPNFAWEKTDRVAALQAVVKG